MKPNWFIGWPVVPTPGLLEELPTPPAGVRVFSAVDLHATLAFLGPVSEDAALRAFTLATEWTGAPIQARFGAVVPMGRPERPSALAAELTDEGDLLVEAMLKFRKPMQRAAGARIDRRPPRPHVTLARPRRRATEPQRTAALEWASSIRLPEQPVSLFSLALYTWAQDRRRSLFRVVEQHILRP